MSNNWKTMLQKAVDTTSPREVAAKLGYSRATISLVLAGKYPGRADKVEARVIEVFGRVECPFEHQVITPADCKAHALVKAPTHNPIKMEHWRACLHCPMRPEGEKS